MSKTTYRFRRYVAIGAFGIFGSALAFFAGARLGSSLDHHTRTVSVAKVPVEDLQPPPPPAAVPPTQVAQR